MKLFTRDDGRTVQVIKGLGEKVLAAAQFAPRDDWDDERYAAKARTKIRHAKQFVEGYERFGGNLENVRALEIACGASIECLLIAMHPVRSVVGIDMELSLFDPGDKGKRMRRLAREVLRVLGVSDDIDALLQRRPIRFATMDATQMSFRDNSFDLVWSHSAMEHIIPPEKALAEIARIVRPGGLIYHAIDPFYWLKGCHKGGVVDVPWAHARLTLDEYYRFVAEHEGETKAQKRFAFLQTLNHFTPRQWHALIEAGPFEILDWKEERWTLAQTLLEEYPDVRETLLDGIEPSDLTCREIKVWMRNTGVSPH